MRLISQDGYTDIPYEQFAITLDISASYSIIWAVSDKTKFAMASYSTSAKALDALKQMRMMAYKVATYFRFPQDEEV